MSRYLSACVGRTLVSVKLPKWIVGKNRERFEVPQFSANSPGSDLLARKRNHRLPRAIVHCSSAAHAHASFEGSGLVLCTGFAGTLVARDHADYRREPPSPRRTAALPDPRRSARACSS